MGEDYGERGVVEKLDVDEIDSKRTTRHLIRNIKSIGNKWALYF